MGKVAEIIREADIAVGNLESPLVTKKMLRDMVKLDGKKAFLDADHHCVSAIK